MRFLFANGSAVDLDISRYDERHRSSKLRLPDSPDPWDFAQLIDVVLYDKGFDTFRFTDLHAADWLAALREARSPELNRAEHWLRERMGSLAAQLSRHPRVPDNHYGIVVAAPPLRSMLPSRIRAMGLRCASPAQWQATLAALTSKGLKSEELKHSGVLTRLGLLAHDATLNDDDVARMVDTVSLTPRLVLESRHAFTPSSQWMPGCERVAASQYFKRGLIGARRNALHVVRHRHAGLGWSIVRTRYSDLFTTRRDWWSVLNENGRSIQQPIYGFDSPQDAMAFAESTMSRYFARWGRDQARAKWERFSLPGGAGYQEMLVQLHDWPHSYVSSHFRTRNVLAHLRTSLRVDCTDRKVLYLDEIQSDWHADRRHPGRRPRALQALHPAVPEAPFAKEWPLLVFKMMLWWAQRQGLAGVAWSTADLQRMRWNEDDPPELLYRSILPKAAQSLATALGLLLATTSIKVRTSSRLVVQGATGWEVLNSDEQVITKPFRSRAQAETFANLTGHFDDVVVPVLWLDGLEAIHSLPLYGVGARDDWQGIADVRSKSKLHNRYAHKQTGCRPFDSAG